MPNLYGKAKDLMERMRCEACGGLGEVSDGEPGDVYANSEECELCHGHGVAPSAVGQLQGLVLSKDQGGVSDEQRESLARWLRAADMKAVSNWHNRSEEAVSRQADAIAALAEHVRGGGAPVGMRLLLELMDK